MRRAGSRIRSRAGRQGVRYVRARWPCVVWFGIISTVPQAYHGRSLGRWQGEYLAGTGDLSLLTNAGSDPSAVSRTLRSLPSSANNRTIRRTPVGIIIATRWRLAAALKQMVWSNAFFVSVRSINKTPTASCAPYTERIMHVPRTNCICMYIHNARMYMMHAGKCVRTSGTLILV